MTPHTRPLSETTVAVHIHRQRLRLKPVGLTIHSFRGSGYTLEPLNVDSIDNADSGAPP
jgi:DNA-binding response OmpR family regulator